jgi:hypothetical protein
MEARCFSFRVASVALEINSLRKISWSLYRNFLMSGKMLSTETLILPVVIGIRFCCQPYFKKSTKSRKGDKLTPVGACGIYQNFNIK